MIINLLNNQPVDTVKEMQKWMTTQFNTSVPESDELEGMPPLESLKDWANSDQFDQRKKVISYKIKKSDIKQLKNDIVELSSLKSEMQQNDEIYQTNLWPELMKKIKEKKITKAY